MSKAQTKNNHKTTNMQLTEEQKARFEAYLKERGKELPKIDVQDSQVDLFRFCIEDVTTRSNLDKNECQKYLHDHALAQMLQLCDEEELDIVEASINGDNHELLADYFMSNLDNMFNYIQGFLGAYSKLCNTIGILPNSKLIAKS